LPRSGLAHRVASVVPYPPQIRLFKSQFGQRLARRRPGWLGSPDFDVTPMVSAIQAHAPGRSFLDVGCMWGVHGRYTFLAEEAGSSRAMGLDVMGPTPECLAEIERRGSTAEFFTGDVTDADVQDKIGLVDVVFCSGVLYHHPSPWDLLLSLRRMTGSVLVLGTQTIPEVPGLPGAAVYWPSLDDEQRRLWQLQPLGAGQQLAISTPYQAESGYGNWFWGMSPSCVRGLLHNAGFEVIEEAALYAFGHQFTCRPFTPAWPEVDEPH